MQLLEIIKGDGTEIDTNIKYALMRLNGFLKEHNLNYGDLLFDRKEIKFSSPVLTTLSGNDFSSFLNHMIDFLKFASKNINEIEVRVNKEMDFVKQRTETSYKEFIELLNDEMKMNQKMVKIIGNAISDNTKIFQVGEQCGYDGEKAIAVIMVGVIGGFSTVGLAKAVHHTEPKYLVPALVFSSLVVLGGVISALHEYYWSMPSTKSFITVPSTFDLEQKTKKSFFGSFFH
jgi:hypothetical protein